MEDHGSLFEGHGLELGGVGVEAAEGGEGLGVVGEGTGGDVGDSGLEGGFTGGVFEGHQLGVAAHAVGDPGVVEGGGGDLGAPPLVGEGVGEEARGVARVGDAGAGNGSDFRGPEGGDAAVVGELDDRDMGRLWLAEGGGHEFELFGGILGEGDGVGLVFFEDVNANVVDAGRGDRVEELASDDRSGEAGAGPDEGVLGAVVGEGFGGGDSGSGADDALVIGDADVHLGGEAVGEEAALGEREPAAGIEQDGDRVGDRGELDAFDGAGFGADEGSGIGEGPGGGGAFAEGLGGGDAEADGGGAGALGGEGLAGGIGDGGDAEAAVELEVDGGEVFKRGEGDGGGGGEVVGSRIEVGVDGIGGDLKLGARRRGVGGRGDQGSDEGKGTSGEARVSARSRLRAHGVKNPWGRKGLPALH